MDMCTIRKYKDPEELAAIQCSVNGVNVRDLTVFFLLIQVKFWSQHISFILVGIIIVTSIRGLLITLTKVRVRTPNVVLNQESYYQIFNFRWDKYCMNSQYAFVF